jgi:serine/threonine protein phosphatase 1
VIGDVHGCVELLEEVLSTLNEAGVERIVTVGDYVDRGERSANVLHTLRARSSEKPETLVCLMGNH